MAPITSKPGPHGSVDLNDVSVFVRVARAASFSLTAREFRVPVSTVSRRVARLEAALGAHLLERTTRRIRLTDVGRTYLEYAERALDALAHGDEHVRSVQAAPRGRVRISAPVGFGPMLVAALATFLRSAPHVSVELDLTERRVDLLAEGFDIALRTGPAEDTALVARRLASSVLGLFASRAYLDYRGRPRQLADLRTHDLIGLTQSPLYGAVWSFVAVDGVGAKEKHHTCSFRPRFVVSELTAARLAALSGIGIALLPVQMVEGEPLERVLPDFAGQAVAVWLLYRSQRRRLSAAVRACLDHLLECLPLESAPP